MSFDYDKIEQKKNEHGSWWTSYADLFMMLSIVFLLMYVASSLRNGSAGFQQMIEYKKLSQKAADLEEQIKVYNTLKDDALKKDSTEEEQQVYQKLMDKLSLLQENAKDEKEALRLKAKENEEKEFALNQYQQLIRNIINTNILAKKQIVHRDQIIVAKDATIEEKKQKIAEMELVVAGNKKQIDSINDELNKNIQALHDEQVNHQISKAAYEKKIAGLRQESERKVASLEENNRNINNQLDQVKSTLNETTAQLNTTTQQLGQANVTIGQQKQENAALATQLESDRMKYTNELNAQRQAHADMLAAERAKFEANLRSQRLSQDAKAKKLAKFAEEQKIRAGQLESQLDGLRGKIADTEAQLQGTQSALNGAQAQLADSKNQLANTQGQLADTQGQLANTQGQLVNTQGALAGAEAEKGRALAAVESLKDDLAKTREIANARKKLAQQIVDQFAKSGIKGNVDGKTGEVTLDFGDEYFDTGSTTLKPKMEVTLDKFIPIYAKSLFSDPKVADKIGSVEIVGFASSTYKGKYVNPKSVEPGDKDALEYNLKLSFGRANSIFHHVLNENDLSKEDRDRLLPLMKVVGRGYLPDGMSASDLPDHVPEKEFCGKYNCKAAQKVIVKFNMKD